MKTTFISEDQRISEGSFRTQNVAATKKPLHFTEYAFLIAESNSTEPSLLQRAFREAGILNPVHNVADGYKATDYVRGVGEYSNRLEYPFPQVALLDLNLLQKDGFEVLKWIRSQPGLNSMIVVLLTSANSEADAEKAREAGADFYITKPAEFPQLVKTVQCLHQWLQWFQRPA